MFRSEKQQKKIIKKLNARIVNITAKITTKIMKMTVILITTKIAIITRMMTKMNPD